MWKAVTIQFLLEGRVNYIKLFRLCRRLINRSQDLLVKWKTYKSCARKAELLKGRVNK